MNTMSYEERRRARRIVKKAADIEGSNEASEWLRRDERGTWEKTAGELWEKSAERRVELKVEDEHAETLLAAELRIMALTAILNHEKSA